MLRVSLSFAVALIIATASLPLSYGQLSGSRPSGKDDEADYWWSNQRNTDPAEVSPLALLDRRVANDYISIEGRAEIRVKPTEIRLVLAVIAEGETGPQCQRTTEAAIARLRAAWTKMGIAPERISEDFIKAVPRYQWVSEQRHNESVKVEKKVGIHVQTNVHLITRGETEARAAIARAVEQDVTDIVACDYWSKELDEMNVKARQQALAAARSKADVLLGALFDGRLPVINVQEQTTVKYPESLYHMFTSQSDASPGAYWRWSEETTVGANRAYSYYRILNSDGDIVPRELPLNPEISVVSTVRLYYRSPAGGHATEHDSAAKAGKSH